MGHVALHVFGLQPFYVSGDGNGAGTIILTIIVPQSLRSGGEEDKGPIYLGVPSG